MSLINQYGYPVYNYNEQRDITVAGHCKTLIDGISNYTYKSYPFWSKNTYFKPLDLSKPTIGDKVSFEGIPTSNLYTSKL